MPKHIHMHVHAILAESIHTPAQIQRQGGGEEEIGSRLRVDVHAHVQVCIFTCTCVGADGTAMLALLYFLRGKGGRAIVNARQGVHMHPYACAYTRKFTLHTHAHAHARVGQCQREAKGARAMRMQLG